jgi:two-component system LytT family sensor kinase
MSKNKIFSHWKVAIVFSALLPLFAIINNYESFSEIDWSKIISNWIIVVVFVMIYWFANAGLSVVLESAKKPIKLSIKIPIIIVSNIALLAFFAFLRTVFDYNQEEFTAVGTSSFFVILARGSVIITLIYIIQYALKSSARAQEVTLQNQMLKTENIQAQYEILKQQISPHFLFNSLSTLRSMIRSGNDKAEDFVINLSEIYRKLLLKNQKPTISLKDELEFINDYSFLLFKRFENMLLIEIDIPDTLMNKSLPTFGLQLLMENCVKHNILSKEKPLKIKIFDSDLNSITIENNLQKKQGMQEHSGIGLENLEKRYSLLGAKDGISVFSDETVFRVKLKLLEP